MRVLTGALGGMAVLALAQAAVAAPPKVAGKYAVMIFEQCSSAFNYTNDSYLKPPSSNPATGPGVKGINTMQNGEFGIEVGTFTFPAVAATSGSASVALTNVSGASLRINNGGNTVTVQTENISGTFSVAAATFTFTPASQPAITWTASYGDIVSGIARTLYFVRKDGNLCVQGMSLTKQ